MARTFALMAARSPSRLDHRHPAQRMNTAAKTNWPWRLLGVAVVLLCVVIYEPTQGGVVQRLLLPLIMGISAMFIVQNVLSVMLAGTLLAGIHSNWSNLSLSLAARPAAEPWIDSFAYPALTLICLVIAGAILLQRFRAHIRTTHDARWQTRRDQSDEQDQ